MKRLLSALPIGFVAAGGLVRPIGELLGRPEDAD